MLLLQPSARGGRRRSEGPCGPEATGKAQGGGEAEARPCCVGCFSVPGGEGADGVTGAETTEVGIQWVFRGPGWAVWLEQKGIFRGSVRTLLCLSLCLPNFALSALRVRPNLIPLCFHSPSAGPGIISINVE